MQNRGRNLEIICLPKEEWEGTVIPMRYITEEYFDVEIENNEMGYHVEIHKRKFDTPVSHYPEEYDFPDKLYQAHWEKAYAWGIVEENDGSRELLACIETCPEEWSNRLMVTELWVHENLRRQGIGHRLMAIAKEQAIQEHRRAIILETQSCNTGAIAFYEQEGFQLIGFDSCCYSNNDIERREVRINMGYFFRKKKQEDIMNTFEKAKRFIYRNARPLDLARWQYHFENGSQEAVLTALEAYQNEDGGFGYALEADCFNPNSSPIQTWAATEILRGTGVTDAKNPLIQKILCYLESGADFDVLQNQWPNTVPSNNDYPCAIWWKYDNEKGSIFDYNPTACLAGFAVKYANKNSRLYGMACEMVKQAVTWFCAKAPFEEMHVTKCFIRLYEYCVEAGVQLFDRAEFLQKLIEQVNYNLVRDTEKWKTDYCVLPSDYIISKKSPFYETNIELVQAECGHIIENQLPDGSYAIPWQWGNEYKEYEIAANWWKSDFVIRRMLYLREFDEI